MAPLRQSLSWTARPFWSASKQTPFCGNERIINQRSFFNLDQSAYTHTPTHTQRRTYTAHYSGAGSLIHSTYCIFWVNKWPLKNQVMIKRGGRQNKAVGGRWLEGGLQKSIAIRIFFPPLTLNQATHDKLEETFWNYIKFVYLDQ